MDQISESRHCMSRQYPQRPVDTAGVRTSDQMIRSSLHEAHLKDQAKLPSIKVPKLTDDYRVILPVNT